MAHEFTVKDALAIIDAEIARQDAAYDKLSGAFTLDHIGRRNEAHAARMALLAAKNQILAGCLSGWAN